MSRVQGGSPFGPSVVAERSSYDPAVTDLLWHGWLPFFRIEGRTPDERARAHGVNVANRRLGVEAYAGFLDRWVKAARGCSTEDEVIALGRPVLPRFPKEPGARESERKDLDAVDEDCTHLLREALGEVGRIRARLADRRAPLDVRLEARVGLKVETGTGSCSLGASLAGGVEAGCRAPAGGVVGLGRDGTASRTIAAGPASVTFGADRIESVELSHGPAYVRSGADVAAAGIGGQRALGAGRPVKVSAEARVGVEVQLLDAETVRRALSNEDFWAKKR